MTSSRLRSGLGREGVVLAGMAFLGFAFLAPESGGTGRRVGSWGRAGGCVKEVSGLGFGLRVSFANWMAC